MLVGKSERLMNRLNKMTTDEVRAYNLNGTKQVPINQELIDTYLADTDRIETQKIQAEQPAIQRSNNNANWEAVNIAK